MEIKQAKETLEVIEAGIKAEGHGNFVVTLDANDVKTLLNSWITVNEHMERTLKEEAVHRENYKYLDCLLDLEDHDE